MFGQQRNNLTSLSVLTQPQRDLDLLTKTLVKNDLQDRSSSSSDNDDDVVANEFCSFMFWRQPLPSIAMEDLSTLLASSQDVSTSDTDDADSAQDPVEYFDEFNYWRVPIADVDVSDLLRCFNQL